MSSAEVNTKVQSGGEGRRSGWTREEEPLFNRGGGGRQDTVKGVVPFCSVNRTLPVDTPFTELLTVCVHVYSPARAHTHTLRLHLNKYKTLINGGLSGTLIQMWRQSVCVSDN